MNGWLFDLGNTRLKYAPLLPNGSVGEVVAVAHDGAAFASDWTHALPRRFDTAFVSSVAPTALRVALFDALCARCGRISRAATQAGFADRPVDGVRIAYADPERLGVDRFLAMLGARARGTLPWLVVGVGTALTIDLLDDAGTHRGGRIALSPTAMREALHARASQLPLIGGRYVEFATDTDDALASGCDGAAIALIEHSMRIAEGLLGTRPGLLVHGGGGYALIEHLDGAILAPTLVLEGLARWAGAEDRAMDV
ncbi:MAG: type III pantothenate kinase [Luteimonas sp.]